MPSVVTWLYSLSFEMSRGGAQHRIRGLFERALENDKLRISVILWRCYIEYEMNMACNPSAARRVFFRAIHACPWYDHFLQYTLLGVDKYISLHHHASTSPCLSAPVVVCDDFSFQYPD